MKYGGYTGKFLTVDLSTGTIRYVGHPGRDG